MSPRGIFFALLVATCGVASAAGPSGAQEPIDELGGLATPLKDGDEVAIIPALAGGA